MALDRKRAVNVNVEEEGMKAAVLYGKKDLRITEVKKPSLGSREILIACKSAGLCGSDLHLYRGTWEIETPRIIGHEATGIIAEAGRNVDGWKCGDRVVIEPVITCGECYWCRESEINNYFCENYYENVIGFFSLDGTFADYVKVPQSNIYRLPDSLSFDESALIEPLSCALRGIYNINIESGDSVGIIGLGTLGLLFAQLARVSGAAKIIGIEVTECKLNKARELGVDVTINPEKEDSIAVVKDHTEGRGLDVVIEAVGAISTYEQALQLARRGGRVCLFGIAPQGTMNIDAMEAYRKELLIKWVFGSPRGTFKRSIELLANGRVIASPLITHKFPLEEILEAMTIMDQGKEEFIKIMIHPNPSEQ
ncbi:MAG: zinc-binding dehydrogenase [Candidatus Hodarchaeota archaeon]